MISDTRLKYKPKKIRYFLDTSENENTVKRKPTTKNVPGAPQAHFKKISYSPEV